MKELTKIQITSNGVKKIKAQNVLIVFALVFAFALPNTSLAYYQYANTGYKYTDYNSGAINYYNHYPTSYSTYSQYYPQYYTMYYVQPQKKTCWESNYRAQYYEESNRSPRCSDKLEDWNNKQNLPNHFLSNLSSSYEAVRY